MVPKSECALRAVPGASASRRCLVMAAPLLLCAGGAAPALAVAAGRTVTVAHAKGQVEVSAAPRRVVVYDVGALDIFQALGLPAAGVPRGQWPDWLAGYTGGRAVAGTLFEPDYEALSRLRPDLIIVGGRSAPRYDTLSRIAPTLDMGLRSSHVLQDMARNIDAIASLYGRQAQGRALAQKVEAEVAALRRQASQAAPGLLLMAINERLAPQAPGSRFGALLFDTFGARSAITGQEASARGAAYTFDDVARLDPEWIYVIDRNTATGQAPGGGVVIPSQQVFDNAQVKGTRAGRKGQVVFLDPKGWYLMGSAGPSATLNNVAQLRHAINLPPRS